MSFEERVAEAARINSAWPVVLWCPHGEAVATSADHFRSGGWLEDQCAAADQEREDAVAAADVAAMLTPRAMRKARRAAKRARPEDFQ